MADPQQPKLWPVLEQIRRRADGTASRELLSHPARLDRVRYRPPRGDRWHDLTVDTALDWIAAITRTSPSSSGWPGARSRACS